MSEYLVGPTSFGSAAQAGFSGEFALKRPARMASPCLCISMRVDAGQASTTPFLLGSTLFILSAQRRLSPSQRSGEPLRLPRQEACFDLTVVQPGQSARLEAEFPLNVGTIQKLDDLRDAEYGLHLQATVRLRFTVQGVNSVLTSSGMDLGFDLPLTNDNWRELLKIWDWPRIRVFEIRASSFPTARSFEGAARKLDEAQRALEQGDAQGAITLSREVIDAVLDRIKLDDHHTERNEKHGPRHGSITRADFQQAGVATEMWDLYVALTQIARVSEEPDGYAWSLHEARMMLAFAAGMAEHLGSVFQRAQAMRPSP